MDVEPRGRARADRGQFSLVVRQIRPYWRRFLVAILLGVAASTPSLLQPALIASMVTALENSTGILPSVLLLLALLTTSAALSGFQTYALGTLGEQVTGRIRMTYVRAVLRLPVCALEAYRRADLVARATSDTTLLRVALTEGAGQIIGGVIMFVGALIAMAFVSPLLLLATVVTVTIGLVCVMALSGRLRNASTQVQEGVSSLGSSLDQSIFASKTIRSLNAADWAISRVDRTIDAAKQAGIRFARVSSAVTPLSGVVMQLCLAVVLGLGAFQVANGTLPVAQLVAFVMYVFLLLTPVGQAVRAMTSLSQATAAARRLAEVEEEAEAPEERSGRGKAQATSVSGPTPVPEANDACAVEFADVHFAYPATGGGATAGEPKPALRGVTFAVPPGAKVGIVGPSGSGKSTILNLIAGFYSPQKGSVRIAGIAEASDPDVRDRGLIGLVEQDAPVIAGTLRDNLTLGDPEIGEADCLQALSRVNLDHLYSRDRGGLDLELSDQGTNLSGGERQRLAIARVLLRRRPILLLDESTSQMDSDNEQKLRDAVAEAGRRRTTIVVAHRLSTIVDSDFILVVRDGEIEAVGRHSELVATSPTYSVFADQQRLIRG